MSLLSRFTPNLVVLTDLTPFFNSSTKRGGLGRGIYAFSHTSAPKPSIVSGLTFAAVSDRSRSASDHTRTRAASRWRIYSPHRKFRNRWLRRPWCVVLHETIINCRRLRIHLGLVHAGDFCIHQLRIYCGG